MAKEIKKKKPKMEYHTAPREKTEFEKSVLKVLMYRGKKKKTAPTKDGSKKVEN